jgi:hypothetical protein
MWHSRTVLLSGRPSVTCVALAEALEPVSPARLTRMGQAPCSGPTRLARACRPRFVWARGALLLDDPGRPKPWATAIEGRAWGYARQDRQPVDGLALVRVVWTPGTVRIPLGRR